MYKLDPEAAASVLGTRRAEGEQSLSTEEQAAVQIQVGFPTPHTRSLRLQAHCDCQACCISQTSARGMMARKLVDGLLTQKLVAEDEERLRREELLMTEMWAESETMELQQKRKERQVLQRQTKLAEDAAALAIQKAWKRHTNKGKADRIEGVLRIAGEEVV